ncbi:MAG: hypothetical protein V4440_07465 [Pseudomonadota bacterium]
MSSYAKAPIHELSLLLGSELANAMQKAYRIALQQVNAEMYPDGSVVRRAITREQPIARQAVHEPVIQAPKLPLDWIERELVAERAIIYQYKRDRAKMMPIEDANRLRTLEAAKRIKNLETIIRKHYSSATNGKNKL